MKDKKKKVSVVCPFCGAGCKFILVVADDTVTGMEFIPQHPVAGGSICLKGSASLDIIQHPNRLRTPLIKRSGGFEEASWDTALHFITQKLLDIKEKHKADSVAFLASAKATNEENYLFQKLARLFGSPHVDHCARLCHAPSLVGLLRSLGSGTQTNPIYDLENASCILVVGSNFAENHPVVSKWVWNAKDNGAFVIVVDPRYTPTASMADLFIQITPGTDRLLLYAMMKVIFDEGLYDFNFINERTSGFDTLAEFLSSLDIDSVSKKIDVDKADILLAARRFAQSDRSSLIYCMGITQHARGTDNVHACVNLALMCGHVGKAGAGIYPLRGQNNVQGACDMGCLAEFYPGYVHMSNTDEIYRIARQWNVEDLPRNAGITNAEIAPAIQEGKIRALVIMGENPVVSDPASGELEQSLDQLDFLVVSDIFLSETAALADVVLPAACWAEKAGSYTNTERRVQWSNKALNPLKHSREDLWIINKIGNMLNLWSKEYDVQTVAAEISETVPQYRGITPDRLKKNEAGIIWPCPDTMHPGTPLLYENDFLTPDGKANFISPSEFPLDDKVSDYSEKPYNLITGRFVEHYNSGSITRRLAVLYEYRSEPSVFLNPEDARILGLDEKGVVKVKTNEGEKSFKVVFSNDVKKGCVFIPFHFPGVNYLTLNVLDRDSKMPGFKDTYCMLEVERK